MNSPEFLDAVKKKHGIPSDRKLARFLGMSPGRISLIRTGTRKIDDATAVKIARALDEPAGYVLAMIQAERAKRTEISGTWRAVAERVREMGKGTAAAFVLAVLAGGILSPQPTHSAAASGLDIHYTQYRRRRWAEALGHLRSWLLRLLRQPPESRVTLCRSDMALCAHS